ncbi:hypothetical protein [Streptomyces sp. NPDC058084]|uniref:hypothetical protein n=1 Tax=Streptomyces sp. NPDC058084 TaxID=3346333 RepID=UPI0036F00476
MAGQVEPGGIINTGARPRMLIKGFGDSPQLVAELSTLCPTVKHIESLREVRQAEWDVIVSDDELSQYDHSFNRLTELAMHISAVYCASWGDFHHTIERRRTWKSIVTTKPGVISQEIMRVRGLPERIATLTHEQLEPVLKVRESHQHFGHSTTVGGKITAPEIAPFILTPDGHILAGRYSRGDAAEAWLLPHDTPDLLAWVRAALAEWHELAPDRFPGVPDWCRTSAWLSPREAKIVEQIADIDRKRDAELSRLNAAEAALKAELGKVRQSVDSYERALLTAQSDELKHAVIAALREIGFLVEDADEGAVPDDHLEDLRISDAEAPGWVCLGEVKGYTRGAKTEGITQFIRFNMRYTARTGGNPDACWYIVNQFIKRDPSTRQPALHGKDEDVSVFGQAGGLVIDTVELFKALKSVQEGTRSASQVRSDLRGGSGRYRAQA